MIVHCPSCDAINDVPPARASSGGTVFACSSCGHEWTESRLNDIGPEPKSRETGPDIHQLMLAARQAREAFTTQRRQRQIKAASWLGLLMLAMSPLLVALALPERVVAVAPASIAFYNWLGWDVNIYGLDIRKLAVEHLNADGHPMITVKGELTNISGSDRKLPWLRFSLRNDDYVEVYTWQLDTRAQLLKPGESRSFATKLASPRLLNLPARWKFDLPGRMKSGQIRTHERNYDRRPSHRRPLLRGRNRCTRQGHCQ